MKLRTILMFSWRYFVAKKSTNAINVISWVSVTAVLFGTASLIIILSAFNGFESLVKSLYSSFYADIRVGAERGKEIVLTNEQLKKLKATQGVYAVSLSVEEKALLQHEGMQTVVQLKGVDTAYPSVSGVNESMYRGSFNTGSEEKPGLVMGVGVEHALGLLADRAVSSVSLFIPRKNVHSGIDPMQAIGIAAAYPTGSFAIQSDFDNKYVITDLSFLKTSMGWPAQEYSYAEIKVTEGEDVSFVKEQVSKMLGKGYRVEDRFEQNRMLYTTIRVEKLVIYAIFSLILLVASFNMIGALSMLVIEKKKDIQVLKAMGADDLLIQKIFLAEGMLLAVIGTIGGMLIALLLYYLQVTYKLVPLQGATFLIDYYPVKLVLSDFIAVMVTVLLIGMLASWLPSKRAAAQAMELRG